MNSTTSLAILARDIKCCLSASQDGLERAQLFPQSERDWFENNDMQWYNTTLGLANKSWIDDKANSIALRSDIHDLFVAGSFVIVRKDNNWVAHFFKILKRTYELGAIYHDRLVSINMMVSPHFLLARLRGQYFSS
jgi:HNH endonuclease